MQACADDPQVAFHAVRNLARIARGVAVLRWSQLGFGRTSSTSRAQDDAAQPDGLQGRHRQHQGRGPAALDEHVWVGGDGRRPVWLRGGTYLVARRIRMLIEVWDRASLDDQEDDDRPPQGLGGAAGRQRDESRPARPEGLPPTSHVRLAPPEANGGATPPAARLLVHRRARRPPRPARRRAVLHQLPARSGRFVRIQRTPGGARRAQRVHRARRLRRVGGPARRAPRGLGRRDAARLTRRSAARLAGQGATRRSSARSRPASPTSRTVERQPDARRGPLGGGARRRGRALGEPQHAACSGRSRRRAARGGGPARARARRCARTCGRGSRSARRSRAPRRAPRAPRRGRTRRSSARRAAAARPRRVSTASSAP